MKNRILLLLLILAAFAGITAVLWFVLKPVLPASLSLQPPPSGQQPSEKPFNPTPAIPQPATTEIKSDTNSPAERERQAQEALKRSALDFAARLNTYSNADGFEALRSLQVVVDPALATTLETTRQQLRREHPEFGTSWGASVNALSASLNTQPPILNATEASVSVQAQSKTESANKMLEIKQLRVDLTFKKNENSWIVTDQVVTNIQ